MNQRDRLIRAVRLAAQSRPVAVAEADRAPWSWFVDLHRTRRIGAAGACPISYAEIGAYAQMTGQPLAPRHVALIRAIDNEFLRIARAAGGASQATTGSNAPMTAAAFDAVF